MEYGGLWSACSVNAGGHIHKGPEQGIKRETRHSHRMFTISLFIIAQTESNPHVLKLLNIYSMYDYSAVKRNKLIEK